MRSDVKSAVETCDPKAAAELLRSMAHPMRLTILCRLLDGELPVSGFESELGLKQPSLSQQLGLLREAGLVSTRREAKSVVYCLANHRVHFVLDALHRFFADGPPAATLPSPRVQAPFAARMSTQVQASPQARPVVAPTTECGVFSTAGWPARRDRDGDDNRG